MSKKKKKNDTKKVEEIKEEKESTIEEVKTPEEEKISTETVDEKHVQKHKYKHGFVHFILVLVFLISLVYFFTNLINTNSLNEIISLLSIVLFTLVFVIVGIKINTKNKKIFLLGSLCLIIFFGINLISSFNILPVATLNKVIDFRDKDLTEVIEWANKNNIEVNQEYEYSDMISEYKIISQDITPGTNIKDIKNLTVSISEGPNPYKEIIIPNMVTWESDRVLEFVKNNYLSNVNVSFVLSEDKEDTVIEQDKIGNLKRNEEINLVFSSGEELGYEEVKLIDFKNKSKFEAIFFIKQHHLNYETDEDFDKNIKAGYVKDQSIKAGEMVKVEDSVKLTISKGPEVKVPNLTKMSSTELTSWIIKNKLKVKFTDRYDENKEKNTVIEANFKEGDIISQGTVVEVVLSKGQIKMKDFKDYAEFKAWAEKYNINYEEQHEFNSDVPVGEVISYSYSKGDAIKNNDIIIVKISDGEKIEVPNLIGLTKKEIESKLKKLGLNYNYVYKSSDSTPEGQAIKQSISKGSEVSSGTTITITISTGKPKVEERKQENNSNNNNNNNNNNSNTSTPKPTCDTSKGEEIYLQAGASASETQNMLKQLNPNHKFNFNVVSACPNGNATPGVICNLAGYDGKWVSYCDTINVTLVK